MSTRSGKRIHISFHENTVKSEVDFTKSERKTRSKHTKENLDENASPKTPKVKKRNYVAYPDEGVDTVNGKEDRATRALRKNALKERNTTSTESLEPVPEGRKSTRSTRRTRKFDENLQDATEPEPVNELPKPKKTKKKKTEQETEVKVTKKKSKKKKDRRSGSMVVEDIIQAPNLNRSNMSDSFHSAAGSPKIVKNIETETQIEETVNKTNEIIHKTRKTRSMKIDHTEELVIVEEPRKRKSSTKNIDDALKDATFDGETENQNSTSSGRKRKSSIKITVPSEDLEDNDFKSADKLITPRKSSRNTFDKTTPAKDNFVEVTNSSRKSKRQSVVNGVINIEENPIKANLNTTFEKETTDFDSEKSFKGKMRKSSIIVDKSSPLQKINRKKSIVNCPEPDLEDLPETNISKFNSSVISSDIQPLTENKSYLINTTFEKDSETPVNEKKKSVVDMTFDAASSPFKSSNDMSSPMTNVSLKRSLNKTYDQDTELNKKVNTTFDKETKLNGTFEKDSIENKRKSLVRLSTQKNADTDMTDKQEKIMDTTYERNSKSSLISSDNSMITLDKSDSRISITSDESKNEENILNTTPVLIESSIDESILNTTKTPTRETIVKETLPVPVTPLKREGTFTKDEPEVPVSLKVSRTPTKRMSLPSPGYTPFNVNKSSSKEKTILNVTRSIEKRRSSLAEPARMTKVMFCSPVNNPAVVMQNRRKVIKSNLKGSNKSFVFDDSVCLEKPASRKRSYTQSDAEEARAKRSRLTHGLQHSVDRLSRPRTASASAKLTEPTTPSKKPITPKKSEAKLPRTKLPNFAALHQKQFSRMESLDECQERRAKRAKQLLTPNGALNMLERISPKDKATEPEKPNSKPNEEQQKPDTPIKSLPTFKSLNPGYTRFGFKLNLDVNPFSIPSKAQPKPKENKPNGITRQPTLPSLTGATSLRREVAKQTVMREKSFTDRRSVKRTENRTVIKGVRTNRRFELQMRMRDI